MVSLHFVAIVFALLQIASGRVQSLQKRGTCNHDNCLRGLIKQGAQASLFCTEYLEGFTPVSLLTYTTTCTENPTAVSTACSCLLTDLTTTTTSSKTTSTTTTSSTPTSTQCAASNKYGYVYIEDAYATESAVLYFQFPSITARGQCCNLCQADAGCYGFTEGSENGGSYFYCELALISPNLPPVGPNVSPTCPNGQYQWPQADLSPYVPGSTGGSGQGPCGIF